jgi:hypothetical protein
MRFDSSNQAAANRRRRRLAWRYPTLIVRTVAHDTQLRLGARRAPQLSEAR